MSDINLITGASNVTGSSDIPVSNKEESPIIKADVASTGGDVDVEKLRAEYEQLSKLKAQLDADKKAEAVKDNTSKPKEEEIQYATPEDKEIAELKKLAEMRKNQVEELNKQPTEDEVIAQLMAKKEQLKKQAEIQKLRNEIKGYEKQLGIKQPKKDSTKEINQKANQLFGLLNGVFKKNPALKDKFEGFVGDAAKDMLGDEAAGDVMKSINLVLGGEEKAQPADGTPAPQEAPAAPEKPLIE